MNILSFTSQLEILAMDHKAPIHKPPFMESFQMIGNIIDESYESELIHKLQWRLVRRLFNNLK